MFPERLCGTVIISVRSRSILATLWGPGGNCTRRGTGRTGLAASENLLRRALDIRISAERFREFEQGLQDSSYIKRRFSFGGRYRLNGSLTLDLSLGTERVIADDVGRERFGLVNSSSTFYSAGVEYVNMDNRLNPASGIYYSTHLTEMTRDPAGSDSSVRDRKVNAVGEFALPVPGLSETVFFLRAAWNQTTSSKGEVPRTEQWYLGGASSLRGYREKQFLAGTVSWYNAEIRYLLGRDSRVFLFHDGGFYYNKGGNVRQRYGYGFGFRVRSRVGLIGFDIGLGQGGRLF